MANSTGHKCTQTGAYACSTHPKSKIAVSKGDTFPPCVEAGKPHGATWVLVYKA